MSRFLSVIARRAQARRGNPALWLWIASLTLAMTAVAMAQDNPFKSTEYPVPRFVSLASGEINVRTGPGEKYPIAWVYHKKSLPVEVVLEYDNWRKLRDREGETGWVHYAMISGRRTGITQGADYISLHAKPAENSKTRVKLEKDVIVHLEECTDEGWCEAEVDGYKGWVERKFLWGVYENEVFD